MATTFTATNSGTAATVMDNLLANTNTLRSSFSNATAPSTPVAGQLWLDTTLNLLKVYGDIDGGGADWFAIATAYTDSDVDLVLNQLLNARLENQAGNETPGAGNVGQVYLNTTTAKMMIVSSATLLDTIVSGTNAEYIALDMPVKAADWDATNPPTAVTVGTTPTIRGALFSATNQAVSGNFRIPDGYSGDADLKMEVSFALNAAETANDTVDATLDMVVTTPHLNETLTKTSTQATVSFDIEAHNAQYSTHVLSFTIDYNDATNPVSAGDEIEWEFSLSSVASVAAIIVRRFTLRVPFGTSTLES